MLCLYVNTLGLLLTLNQFVCWFWKAEHLPLGPTQPQRSGARLEALPTSSLCHRMEDQTVRVAVGLHLGNPLCNPHTCFHCGLDVDALATYDLSCRQSNATIDMQC